MSPVQTNVWPQLGRRHIWKGEGKAPAGPKRITEICKRLTFDLDMKTRGERVGRLQQLKLKWHLTAAEVNIWQQWQQKNKFAAFNPSKWAYMVAVVGSHGRLPVSLGRFRHLLKAVSYSFCFTDCAKSIPQTLSAILNLHGDIPPDICGHV